MCVGLANASYLENDIKIKGQAQGVVICPGPNLAYFDQEVSLKDMMHHIYGHKSVLRTPNRPNLFIKELRMYVDYLRNEIQSFSGEFSNAQLKKWNAFKSNLLDGIEYYKNLFESTTAFKGDLPQLDSCRSELVGIAIPVNELV